MTDHLSVSTSDRGFDGYPPIPSEYGGEISRMYFAVVLAGGQMMTVYRDLLTGYWYEQRDTAPAAVPSPVDVLASPQGTAERDGLNRGALPPGRLGIESG